MKAVHGTGHIYCDNVKVYINGEIQTRVKELRVKIHSTFIWGRVHI